MSLSQISLTTSVLNCPGEDPPSLPSSSLPLKGASEQEARSQPQPIQQHRSSNLFNQYDSLPATFAPQLASALSAALASVFQPALVESLGPSALQAVLMQLQHSLNTPGMPAFPSFLHHSTAATMYSFSQPHASSVPIATQFDSSAAHLSPSGQTQHAHPYTMSSPLLMSSTAPYSSAPPLHPLWGSFPPGTQPHRLQDNPTVPVSATLFPPHVALTPTPIGALPASTQLIPRSSSIDSCEAQGHSHGQKRQERARPDGNAPSAVTTEERLTSTSSTAGGGDDGESTLTKRTRIQSGSEMQLLALACEHARSTTPDDLDGDGDDVFGSDIERMCDIAAVRCLVCSKVFCTASYLRRHVRIHTGLRPFSCNACDKSFADKSGLRAHERVHSNARPHACADCGRAFSKRSHLKTHAMLHSGERPYSCEACGKCFSQQSNLRTHARTHTGERPFSCETCGKAFSVSSALRAHQRLHPESAAAIERLPASQASSTTMPLLSVPPEQIDTLGGEMAVTPATAEGESRGANSSAAKADADSDNSDSTCSDGEGSQASFESQQLNLDDQLSEDGVSEVLASEGPMTATASKKAATRGLDAADDEKKHICPVCKKSFGYGFVLTKHLRTHTGERPYGCQDCSRRFSDFSTLRNHRRIHTGEKPYQCNVCQRSFRQIGQVRTHQRTHGIF